MQPRVSKATVLHARFARFFPSHFADNKAREIKVDWNMKDAVSSAEPQ